MIAFIQIVPPPVPPPPPPGLPINNWLSVLVFTAIMYGIIQLKKQKKLVIKK